MTLRKVKIGSRMFSIKRNQWDNVYGYIGNNRVEQFFNTSELTAEQNAEEWLKAMEQEYSK